MDNNEVDKILKEKLNGTIKPSKEFEEKILKMIQEEKQKAMSSQGNESSIAENNSINEPKKMEKRTVPVSKILSMVAIIIVVFTLGFNLKTAPIVADEKTANLISIKAIEPTKMESGAIANNTDFTIYVEGENVNTEAVQKSVYVEPAMEYTIEKTLNKNEYKLKFKQNIPNNTIVKLQYIKNKITENSWAYQTSNKLSISKVYPENGSTQVSKNSIIEVELSHANVQDFEKYVSITPNINGTWKHGGRNWIFTPKKNFKQNQYYTVKISKGLKAGKEVLENDYMFKFMVSDDYEAIYHEGITIDDIITAKNDEPVKIAYNEWYNKEIKFGKVEIGKFSNIDDFIEYVKNNNYEKAVKHGSYDAKDQNGYLELNQNLQNGYYVAKVKNEKGAELFNCPIQITEISAYSIETERDILVWVAKGNELAQNVEVEYQGKTAKTDEKGIAKLENATDGSNAIKYLKVGNELVIGVCNYEQSNYPSAYIYTDRPLYKNTDTINMWGFVPRNLFFDKVEDEFYIELNTEGKQKIKVESDGNFTYKIDLKNHIDSKYYDTSINLYYKNTQIATRSISIENYELQNYTYDIIAKKNYGMVGEEYKFDVKVNHITGLTVPNKKVVATFEEKRYTQTTGEDGIAHFSIKLNEEERTYTYPTTQIICIYNGDDIEYTKAETYINVEILSKNVYMKDTSEENKEFKAELYKLDTNKDVNVEYDLKELYNGPYETSVDVMLKEEERTRHLEGYEYNKYTKINEPNYTYTYEENRSKVKKVTSKNGKVVINRSELKMKKDTEEKTYYYVIELEFKDMNGRDIVETMYVYNEEHTMGENDGYYYSTNSINSDKAYNTKVDTSRYYMYRYFLKNDLKYCKPGETVNFNLSEMTKNGVNNIANEGKVLTLCFKEKITDTNVFADNNISYTFKDEDFPGCKLTSAYFANGKFYRMPVQYFDYEENNKKVDIEITSNKEQYKPGEEVNLKIKTTLDGKAVKSFVNVSVVNEAVFEIEEDITNLLEKIYDDKDYPSYTFSSYNDILKGSGEGGAGGGGDEARTKFADTAHFETVYTNKNGEAEVKFKLPDNVTTYRVTAHSANENLELGVNTKKITSTLDFFIQSVEPRSIKNVDDVVLNATSISEKKYDVNYEFSIKEINKTLTAKAETNTMATVNFGKLPIGTYHASIKGIGKEKTDTIEYKFKVIGSAQEVSTKTEINVKNETKINPTKNPIVLELYNKNMSRYVKYIDFIESTVTERLDTQIAYNKIQEVKEKYYEENSRSMNHIEMSIYGGDYSGDTRYLKNLRNGKEDIVLSALVRYYAKDYYKKIDEANLTDKDNVFEYYLYRAAMGEPVLQDLIYLKDTQQIKNYNKLLVTLSLEFMGDYSNAKELYKGITLTEEEAKQYKSLIAIIETFIDKEQAGTKIDEMIKSSPADEYLRFAILSLLQNNSKEIGKEEAVKVKSKNSEETIKINGMQVKTLTLNNEDLSEISFETESDDIMATYYYQTMLEDIKDSKIKKDIKISFDGKIKKGNTINLIIDFQEKYEGEVRIALPNSLRLAQNYSEFDLGAKYYIESNNIDYITIYKLKGCKKIKLPLLVTNSGSYKFESVVCNSDGLYHISNSIDF